MTLNEALNAAGIETIRRAPTKYTDGVFLKYGDKIIQRPIATKCKKVVLKEFGIELPSES